MFETGIDRALVPPPRPYYFDDFAAEADMLENGRVLKILNDATIREDR